MKYTPNIHHRRLIRLKHYDYAQPGTYFITICTHNRQNLFAEIAQKSWLESPVHFPHV